MGNTYTVKTFNIDEGTKDFHGYENILVAMWVMWQLKRTNYYECISLEWR